MDWQKNQSIFEISVGTCLEEEIRNIIWDANKQDRLKVLWMSSELCVNDNNIMHQLPNDLSKRVAESLWTRSLCVYFVHVTYFFIHLMHHSYLSFYTRTVNVLCINNSLYFVKLISYLSLQIDYASVTKITNYQ